MKENLNNSSDPDLEDSFKSLHQAEKTSDDPLVRVMALHALAYCERLFYLEEVEEIRLADANVYAGRRLHDNLPDGAERYSVELASERLGLRGKVDWARRKSGELLVCEHKKGRSKDGVEAWPSDRLQVLAYALLLAEHSGEPVGAVQVKYHADNRLIEVPFDPAQAELEVGRGVARARELRVSLRRPPVSVPEKLCRTCSLAPVCLPEEERFAQSAVAKPQRLFPAEDGRIVHVVEQGGSIRKDGEQLVVYLPDGRKTALPGAAISALVLHGNVQISTQAVHFCAAREIGVHWLSFGGHYVGALSPGAGGVQRRNRQFGAMRDPLFRARLAVRLATTKIENQLRYILRVLRSRSDLEKTDEVQRGVSQLRQELAALAQVAGALDRVAAAPAEEEKSTTAGAEYRKQETDRLLGQVRGHEGMAGRAYFGLLASIYNEGFDEFFHFSGRNRRPPRDGFNALLSFGYALLYRDCVAALLAVGLEPALGFFHTPRSAAYPLALDLMELFRVILWDVPLLGSLSRKQWRREDFEVTSRQVWLNFDGRRKAIALYEGRKQEKWKHPVLDYSLSYARTMELEARLLEKEWSGQPGLFAKLRLR